MKITGLEPTPSVITSQCLNQCATDGNIYVWLSLPLPYLFNMNSRYIDGHYRSWIEYLDERYNVCILGRSIKWDDTWVDFLLFV